MIVIARQQPLFLPLQPEYPVEPAVGAAILDYPETNLDRLMGVIERLLEPVLATLSKRDELLDALVLRFVFDDGGKPTERAARPLAKAIPMAMMSDCMVAS